MMVSALVRELIHDRLHMKSDINANRFKASTESFENDAYFDMLYLRQRFPVKTIFVGAQWFRYMGYCLRTKDVWEFKMVANSSRKSHLTARVVDSRQRVGFQNHLTIPYLTS